MQGHLDVGHIASELEENAATFEREDPGRSDNRGIMEALAFDNGNQVMIQRTTAVPIRPRIR